MIRRYRPDDQQQIVNFPCRNHGQSWTRDAEAVIREAPGSLLDNPDLAILVAEVTRRERIVGVLVYRPVDGATGAQPTYLVSSLGVASEWRKRGIGTNLKLSAMANVATATGANVVSEVHRANHAMNSINEKLGVTTSRELTKGTEYRVTGILVTVTWWARLRERLRLLQRLGATPTPPAAAAAAVPAR